MFSFEWDEANRGHLAEHAVTPDEAEQVLLNDPFDIRAELKDGEERTVQIGETDEGRILVVVSTVRRSRIRVVTAFPANRTMRRRYKEFAADDETGREGKLQE